MNKNFYNIDEVSQLIGEQKHTIRFWESRINRLKIIRTHSGHRLYDYENLLLLKKIKELLEVQKLTLDGVNNYLSKKGFVKYQLTKLTFLETVYLFHNAEVIVGAHGAALVNLIFCLPKTKVIEIKPITHTQTVFERLSSINNLDYRLIKTKEVDNDKKDKGDIDLSIDELENCFKSFI